MSGTASVSRRAVLLGWTGAIGAAAAAGGVLGGVLPIKRSAPPTPPAVLVSALARENDLIAAALAAARAGAAPAQVIRAIRTDHEAHAAAIRALLSHYPPPVGSPGPAKTPATLGRAQLRAGETAAARSAGQDSSASAGAVAALFASIAACEATHAALLS